MDRIAGFGILGLKKKSCSQGQVRSISLHVKCWFFLPHCASLYTYIEPHLPFFCPIWRDSSGALCNPLLVFTTLKNLVSSTNLATSLLIPISSPQILREARHYKILRWEKRNMLQVQAVCTSLQCAKLEYYYSKICHVGQERRKKCISSASDIATKLKEQEADVIYTPCPSMSHH